MARTHRIRSDTQMNDNYVQIGYGELKGNLCTCVAVILFRKKNGEIRAMMCTRDSSEVVKALGVDITVQLHGHDKRNNEANSTLAVIDLVKEEARAISVEKIIGINYMPPFNGDIAINNAYDYYNTVLEHAKMLNAQEKEDAKKFKNQVAQGGGEACI